MFNISIGGVMNFVNTRDVAKGMILAQKKGRTGERYILGGHNFTYAKFFELVGKVSNKSTTNRYIPYFLAALIGWYGEFKSMIGWKGNYDIGITTIRWSYCQHYTFSSDKAVNELGYNISPIEDGIANCIEWFKKNGHFDMV